MLHITKVMILHFHLTDRDMMGYSLNTKDASYHHLIIPTRNNGIKSIRNGAVLNGKTSHPYLHVVEFKDYDKFYDITKLMILENRLERLDEDALRQIHDILTCFEREYSGASNYLGEPLIKEEYTKRLILAS